MSSILPRRKMGEKVGSATLYSGSTKGIDRRGIREVVNRVAAGREEPFVDHGDWLYDEHGLGK
ncbi:MAG: hypothetical protein ABI824_11670 [Acidobacteriota bacterium]